METLPTESVASIKDGFWFVFRSGNHFIRAWGSSATGMERVYVDENLVSERRTVSKDSVHSFSVGGEDYAIAFKTTSILKGDLQCRLFKNGTVIKAYMLKFVKAKLISGDSLPIALGRLALLFLVGFGIVFVGRYFDLPLWVLLIAVALVFPLMKRGHREGKYSKGGMVIEEIDPITGSPITARSDAVHR